MTLIVNPEKLSKPERILWSFGVDDPADIDLEAIAFDLGASIKQRPLTGCDARLVRTDEAAIISINSDSHPLRQRFSLAHELAHLIEDRGRKGFICAKEDIAPQNSEAKSIEALANDFASQLVLPSYLFLPRVAGKPVSFGTADKVSKEFKCSVSAAAIKLVRCSAEPALLVCHGQSKREWFMRNSVMSTDIWPQAEMHCEAEGFSLLYGAAAGMSRLTKEPANRWLSGPDIARRMATVQSLKVQDGTVLTIVTLGK